MFSNTSKKQSSAQQYTEGQTAVFTAHTVPELLGSLKAFKTRAHALLWMPNGSDPHVGGLLGLSKRQDNHNLHFFRGEHTETQSAWPAQRRPLRRGPADFTLASTLTPFPFAPCSQHPACLGGPMERRRELMSPPAAFSCDRWLTFAPSRFVTVPLAGRTADDHSRLAQV